MNTSTASTSRADVYSRVTAPLEPLRTPAVGDIDGDRRAEIVDTAGEHVYAWELDGTPVAGFPVRLNPDFSRPEDRRRENHVKRGFFAAPVLADLSGGSALEIVATAMDQHVYAFDGSGAYLMSRAAEGGDSFGRAIASGKEGACAGMA